MAHLIINLSNIVTHISKAEDKNGLHSALERATEELGFARFNLSCRKLSPHEFMSNPTLTNFLENDLIEYNYQKWAERDPLIIHASTGTVPLIWTPAQWKNTPYNEYYNYIKAKGVLGGVTVPLSGQDGTFSAMMLITSTRRSYGAKIAHAAAIVGRMAMTRASAIGLIYEPTIAGAQERLRTLTAHQLEILKWIANGKSTFEIALIMQKSKRVTEYHVSEILRKLEVRTRAQAVALYAQM